MAAITKVMFLIPAERHRAWPGVHGVNLRPAGGPSGWAWVALKRDDLSSDYLIYITPCQLVYVAVRMVAMRVRGWFR
jgi:hypothetical protein